MQMVAVLCIILLSPVYLVCTIDYVHSQMTIQLTIYLVKWIYNWLSTNDYPIDYIHIQITIQLTMLLLLLNSYIYKAVNAEFSTIYSCCSCCCWILISIRLLPLNFQQFTAAAAAAAEFLYLKGYRCWIFNNLLLLLLLLN